MQLVLIGLVAGVFSALFGVGGGIIAVLPGQVAVAVFSPRLDEHGNSVRGVAACRRLSRELELHFLHVPRGARSAVESVRAWIARNMGRVIVVGASLLGFTLLARGVITIVAT